MAKINSGNNVQIQSQATTPIQSPQGKAQVGQAESIAQKAQIDGLEQQVAAAKPAATSPLSDTLMAGLTAVADRYYGSEQAAVNPRLRTGGASETSLDAQVPAEVRALKADRLARKTGIPSDTAKEIIDLAAHILTY